MEEDGIKKFSFDCQKKLPLPKLPDQSNYYSRQVYQYNFTICEGSSKTPQNKTNTFIYTWNEKEDKRGANQIVSAVHHRILNTNWDNVSSVECFSDGAAGRNKNSIMIGMISKCLLDTLPPNGKKVTLYFPVTGHSFLPPDRIFGRVERVFRRLESIVTPYTYIAEFEKVGTVFLLGKDFNCNDWKKSCKDVMKPTSSWHLILLK